MITICCADSTRCVLRTWWSCRLPINHMISTSMDQQENVQQTSASNAHDTPVSSSPEGWVLTEVLGLAESLGALPSPGEGGINMPDATINSGRISIPRLFGPNPGPPHQRQQERTKAHLENKNVQEGPSLARLGGPKSKDDIEHQLAIATNEIRPSAATPSSSDKQVADVVGPALGAAILGLGSATAVALAPEVVTGGIGGAEAVEIATEAVEPMSNEGSAGPTPNEEPPDGGDGGVEQEHATDDHVDETSTRDRESANRNQEDKDSSQEQHAPEEQVEEVITSDDDDQYDLAEGDDSWAYRRLSCGCLRGFTHADYFRHGLPLPACSLHGIKYGEHSITTTGNTADILIEMPVPPPSTQANFVRIWIEKAQASSGHIAYDAAAFAVQLTSHIYPNEPGGGRGVPVDVAAGIFHSQAGVFPAITVFEVLNAPSRKIGQLDDKLLISYMNGGVVSERAFVSAVQPKLSNGDLPTVRSLADFLPARRTQHDNSLMYCKLIYHALVLELNDYMGNPALAAHAFVAGFDPIFRNMDPAGQDYMDYAGDIESGAIVFVDRFDFNLNDLQTLMWLSKPEHRLAAAAAVNIIPHATYVNFPGINTRVWYHGAAPAIPAAALLTANSLYAFASKIAGKRNEWDSLIRGMYAALDLLTLEYQVPAAGANARGILADLRVESIRMPAPVDYNVLHRILELHALTPEWCRSEWAAFVGCGGGGWRIPMAAVYGTGIAVLTGTLLYDMNITRLQLQNWVAGVATAPSVESILNSELTMSAGVDENEPPLISWPRRLMNQFLGGTVGFGVYPYEDWNGGRGGRANAAVAMAGMNALRAPCRVPMLSVDNWFSLRPVEWGLCGPGAKINIADEVQNWGGAVNSVGWFSNIGCGTKFLERKSWRPQPAYNLVYYCALAANSITSGLRLVAAGGQLCHYNTLVANPQTNTVWMEAAAAVGAADWNAALHIYNPGSILTYNHDTLTLRAINFRGADIPGIAVQAIANWRDVEVERVGFALPSALPSVTPDNVMSMLPRSFSSFRIGARPADRKIVASEHPPPGTDPFGVGTTDVGQPPGVPGMAVVPT